MTVWTTQFSQNVLGPGGLEGFWFEWPVGQDGVHYVVRPTTSPTELQGKSGIAYTGSISGGPFQALNNGAPVPNPAACHIYFQQIGDNLSGQGPYAYYRWWNFANGLTLQNGDFWSQCTFNPAEWLSVFGEHGDASPAATAGFQQAMANTAFVGFTCGSDQGYGHGVYASQKGAMTVLAYVVQ